MGQILTLKIEKIRDGKEKWKWDLRREEDSIFVSEMSREDYKRLEPKEREFIICEARLFKILRGKVIHGFQTLEK